MGDRHLTVAVFAALVLLAVGCRWSPTIAPDGEPSVRVERDDPDGLTLRWRRAAGDRFRFSVEEKFRAAIEIDGEPATSRRTLRIESEWSVESMTWDGIATIAQRVDRVLVHDEVPGLTLRWDSAEEQGEARPLPPARADEVAATTASASESGSGSGSESESGSEAGSG